MSIESNQGACQAPAANAVRRNEPQFAFIDGWFSQSFAAGYEPDYGYPKNHLPEPAVESMEVETIFFARSKA
jgi:hypothetical protein